MAMTLNEAAKFSTNMVRRGVLETIIKDSVVLQKLPFKEVTGNALQYLQENTLGSASFYNPGDVWIEQTPTFTQKTAVIKIMGGDADVDQFLAATRSDYTDITQETITKKAKGVKHTFLDTFYYGDSSVNPKSFDGLHKLMPAAQVIHQGAGSTPAAVSAANLDTLVDLILDGPPDTWLMSKAMRRRIAQYLRSEGAVQGMGMSAYSRKVLEWGDIPINVDDFLVNTETISGGAYSGKTGGASSSIFLVRFGTDDLSGLQNGSLQTKEIGQLESKDARRWRIKWYPSIALFRDFSVAMIDGVDSAAAMVD